MYDDRMGSGDCNVHAFSPTEAALQARFARWRQRAFAPVLRVLTAAGITPDMLSVLGIAAVLLVPFGFTHAPGWAVAAYALHLVFDGLDGSLARHTGTASATGAYVDVVTDHLAFIVSILVLQWMHIGDPFWALLYAVSYALLVVHVVVLNARGTPPALPVLRTKYVLFLLIVLLAYDVVDVRWLDRFFMVFGAYYAAMTGVFVLMLRKTLSRS